MIHSLGDPHMLVLAFCSAVLVITFSAMFYAIWAHRRFAGYLASSFHKSVTVEVMWALIPCLILVATAFPAAQPVFAAKEASAWDLMRGAIGWQWKREVGRQADTRVAEQNANAYEEEYVR
jgi:cytochrome c oxidase subunit 2